MTPAARQDHILRMMLRGEWRGGRSRKELAAEWKIHERTVGDDAMVASGVLSRRGTPIEDLIDQKLAELEQIQQMALERKGYTIGGEEYDNPDLKSAILTIRLIMDIRGVTTVRRGKEEPAPTSHADLEKLSAQERIAMLKSAIAEEEAKLKGATH
jgi:hypothetical protein